MGEAIRNTPKAIEKIYIAEYFDDEVLRKLIDDTGIPTAPLIPNTMSKDFERDSAHQGVTGLINFSKLIHPFKDFVRNLEVTPDTSLVILGEIQDPQNVGAVIRSAAAFGISGVLIPEHNQAQVTGSVVKVSAGMVFRIPLVTVANVNNAVRELKEKGFWVYGLEGESANSITEEKFDAPTLFILGNESKGIRQKTRENCDVLLSIPTDSRCESLNAAASAAVALYAWSTKHPKIIK